MKAKAFLIRHQHAGLLTDCVYLTEPTAEQIEEARQRCNATAGELAADGKPFFCISHPTVVEAPDGTSDLLPLDPPVVSAPPAVMLFVASGTAKVE